MLAAGASPLTQSAGILPGTIHYACNNYVVVWDLMRGPSKTYDLGSRVGAVASNGTDTVAAGSHDGGLFIIQDNVLKPLHTYEKPVTCLAMAGSLLAAGTVAGVDVWETGTRLNSYTFDSGFYPLSIALYKDIVVVGGTSGIIYALKGAETIKLEGHENWVRSLDFCPLENGDVVLASASQDRFIRLWRFSSQSVEEDPLKSGLSTRVQHLGSFTVFFEALLMGHDDWVLSVKWDPHTFRLLSSSSDSSLIVWAADNLTHEDEGYDLWTPQVRLGDMSILGASTATGASGGFWGAYWLESDVATISRSGAWRIWAHDTWEPIVGITGHTRTVTWVAWMNEYVLSTSLDQTTRLWRIHDGHLQEVSRPQIHGYDMLCCEPVRDDAFVSGGDEKLVRVFGLPAPVQDLLKSLGQPLGGHSNLAGATVPALGLSNKAEASNETFALPQGEIPREDHLQRQTLWPEIEKLYGHGYEISCLDVSPDVSLLATCCKANSVRHAVIRLYTIDGWRQLEPLSGHNLTVTRVRFSPDSKLLLSVSRDRQLFVFDIESQKVVFTNPKAHSRIIWDCCWLSSTEYATVSRDKTVKLWNTSGEVLSTASFEAPVTACDFDGHLVIGLENGQVYKLDENLCIVKSFKADGRIERLAIRRNYVACASETLRVFTI